MSFGICGHIERFGRQGEREGRKRAYRSGWSDSILMNAAGPARVTDSPRGARSDRGRQQRFQKGRNITSYINVREKRERGGRERPKATASAPAAVVCLRSEQETHKICRSNRCRRCFSARTAHARRSYLSLQKMWFLDILPRRRKGLSRSVGRRAPQEASDKTRSSSVRGGCGGGGSSSSWEPDCGGSDGGGEDTHCLLLLNGGSGTADLPRRADL